MPSFADHPAGRRVNGAKGSPMEKRTRTGLSIWLWSRKLLIVNFSDRTDHPCGDWVLPPSYRVDLGDWSYFFFSSVANNTDNSRTVEKKLLHQSKLGRDICFRIRGRFGLCAGLVLEARRRETVDNLRKAQDTRQDYGYRQTVCGTPRQDHG